MKRIGIVSTAALSLLLGMAIPAYAQDEKRDRQEDKDKKDQPAKVEEKRATEAKPAQQEEKLEQEAKPEEKRAQEGKAPQEKNEQHAQPAQHAGAGRIPDDRFKAHFGREHTFRVSQGEYGNRRFQYGGYWFGFAGVWPSNWLYTQDVFVVEINGVYYLCNANYPGVNVELLVTL